LKVLSKAIYSYTYTKTVRYSDDLFDSYVYGKGVRISKQHELYNEFQALKERCKDVQIIMPVDFNEEITTKNTYPKNYDWGLLSPSMKRFIREQDIVAYNRQYADIYKINYDAYDRRIERLRAIYPVITDDMLVDYVLLGKTIPTTSYKKAMDSARRSYKKVNGIIKANLDVFDTFITLTFAEGDKVDKHKNLGLHFDYVDGADFENVKKAFTLLFKQIRRKQEVSYICVWEQTKRGNYHFHILSSSIDDTLLIDNPSILQYDTIKRRYDNSKGLKMWKHGKSDVQLINDKNRMSTYVSKYILKSIYNILEDDEEMMKYNGKKKYFTSTGLVQPIETYTDDSVHDIESFEVYEKEVLNPYNDSVIVKKVYTKKKDAVQDVCI